MSDKPEILPSSAARFKQVAQFLQNGDPARGFVRAAEICLEQFESLARTMAPYAVLKLAIELHKHGLFCEVAQDKARTQHDAAAYAAFQSYLAGTSDTPVAIGLPSVGSADNVVDTESEEVEDGAQDHEFGSE